MLLCEPAILQSYQQNTQQKKKREHIWQFMTFIDSDNKFLHIFKYETGFLAQKCNKQQIFGVYFMHGKKSGGVDGILAVGFGKRCVSICNLSSCCCFVLMVIGWINKERDEN